jgi:hypothetical protein
MLRHAAEIPATVLAENGQSIDVSILNRFAQGCCVSGAFASGERITVSAPQLGELPGQVRWVMLGQAGVRSEQPSTWLEPWR